MKQLRLLLWPDCNRSCAGCCNKQWDLSTLPVCTDYTPFDTIMLTGGEPLLHIEQLAEILRKLYWHRHTRLILYTAYSKLDSVDRMGRVLPYLDGLTLTLHEQSDVRPMLQLDAAIWRQQQQNRMLDLSLRLNVFAGIYHRALLCNWTIKSGIEWIDDCPLPKNEEFMRYD